MPMYSGALLRAQIRARGLHYDWVARSVGISHSGLYKLLSGENSPSAATLGRLAAVLRCSVADLFAEDETIGGAA